MIKIKTLSFDKMAKLSCHVFPTNYYKLVNQQSDSVTSLISFHNFQLICNQQLKFNQFEINHIKYSSLLYSSDHALTVKLVSQN